MDKATGSFQLASWSEDAYEEHGVGKLTLASVTQEFSGDITGDGSVRWLMAYRADGTAHFTGLQRVTGTLAGRRGTFVLETSGDFDGQVARWTATVIADTGTDELIGLEGTGSFGAKHGPEATYEIEYRLPPKSTWSPDQLVASGKPSRELASLSPCLKGSSAGCHGPTAGNDRGPVGASPDGSRRAHGVNWSALDDSLQSCKSLALLIEEGI